MKLLKGFLVFILIVVIVGGLGFVAYNLLFKGNSGNMSNSNVLNTQSTNQTKNANKNVLQNNTGMTQNSDISQQTPKSAGLSQSSVILLNKESLNKSITSLNDALKLLSFDPYSPGSTANSTGSTQNNSQTNAPQSTQGNNQANPTATPAQGSNNTINVYPQTSSQPNTSQQNNTNMQNMGTTYDANKMEQVHNGLYKISLGMALLNQLQTQLVAQEENATANTQDLAQYYTNQFSLATQNKAKLTQALTYINDAVSLVNINPYVSSAGIIYDKDRMNQVHQSVYKLAEGVASLNLLSDDFTKQGVTLSNTAQMYINNSANSQMANNGLGNGIFGGLFDNVNAQTVVNVILIIFVIGLILGVLGFIYSQLKPKDKDTIL